MNAPVQDRIMTLSPQVLKFLQDMDSNYNYSFYEVSNAEKKIFMDYYDLLPAEFKTVFEERVIAIYFIKNFEFCGMTNFVFDESGDLYFTLYSACFRFS